MNLASEIRDMDLNAFENPKQGQEYVSALRQCILAFKFAYIGRAAYTHDELVRSQEYGLADTEAGLIRARFASTILPKLNMMGLNVVDIGAGNGTKALTVLEIIHQTISSLRYMALDYSETLLQIAIQNILSKLPWLDTSIHRIDFEASSFRDIIHQVQEKNQFPVLALLLGQTLGNPPNRLQALLNIRQSLRVNDSILIGVELFQQDRISEVLAHYQNESFFRAIFNSLTFAGLQRADGVLEVSFNELTRDVEVHFTLTKSIQIRANPFGDIKLEKGDRLLIGVSHRFIEPELKELLTTSGFVIQDIVLNDNRTYALILAHTF